MKKRLISALASVVLGCGSLLLIPTAQAAQGDCAAGYTCMWEHASYQGGAVSFQRYIPDLSQWKLTNGRKANDVISSAKNMGRLQDACLFADANGRGEVRRMVRGAKWAGMSTYGMNDKISSAYFTGYKSC